MASYPLGDFFEQTSSCNYPPLYLLVLKGVGHLEQFIAAQCDPMIDRQALLDMLIRIPPCLADLLAALLLYVEGRRVVSRRCGVAAAALYFLNPVAIYNSAYWGQVDGVHSCFLLGALVATNRMRPGWTGVALGLAILTKLQSVAFAPLFIFDVYRWRRFRGLAAMLAGMSVAAIGICTPYALAGSLPNALQRGYVQIIGQYEKLSVNAFNPWYLTGTPDAPDGNVPRTLVHLAADGQDSVADDASVWLQLTWRRLSQLAYVTLVALILLVYASNPGVASRALCAGLLGLAFFLALTEMHERYTHPVFALLPLWAVSGAWRERAYVALSVLALLNIVYVMHPEHLGGGIAVLFSLLLIILLAGMAGRRRTDGLRPDPDELASTTLFEEPSPPRSKLVSAFCACSLVALVGWLVGGGMLLYQIQTRGVAVPVSNTKRLYLSDLEPIVDRMDYGQLQRDRSLEGGAIHLGNRFYLRGLGTHASCTIEYGILPEFDRFRAVVGIDRHFDGKAKVSIEVDGTQVFESLMLESNSEPVEIDISIVGGSRIRLIGHAIKSNKGDHIDWGLARFARADHESLP